ncbi:MAG: helix-turn-helix transcriptional regulator [Candidatus Desulforudis sp.]|nr:helix-turn-helix transcriptional regulator [Desulforudis sp.]
MKMQNRLEDIRWELRLSKKEMAERIGCLPNQYSRWISQQQQPNQVWMLRIASALKLSVEQIFYLVEDEQES